MRRRPFARLSPEKSDKNKHVNCARVVYNKTNYRQKVMLC